MLIPFSTVCKTYASVTKVRGVFHVGANTCEEAGDYAKEGVKDVCWLEADPSVATLAKARGFDCHQILASDTDNQVVDFNIANQCGSSSMLELGEHRKYHPGVFFTGTVRLNTKRVETLVKEQKIDMSKYNFLNIDTQGAELKVLKGMESLLPGFDILYLEVNTAQVYIGCPELPELDAYLSKQGFTRKETVVTDAKWGDAVYVRNNLLATPTTQVPTQPAAQRILLDVGAHRGLHADAHMAKFDKLVLVEAAPQLADFLRKKYQGNPKVTIVEKLVSDEKSVTFYSCNVDTVSTASPQWVNASRFSDKGFIWTPTVVDRTISMDELIKTYGMPSRTKIDVEAYEYSVLKSLSQYVGPLSFEWAEEVQKETVYCIYHLLKLGYTKFYVLLSDQYDFTPPDHAYMNADQLIAALNTWIPKRRDLWGMIHCL